MLLTFNFLIPKLITHIHAHVYTYTHTSTDHPHTNGSWTGNEHFVNLNFVINYSLWHIKWPHFHCDCVILLQFLNKLKSLHSFKFPSTVCICIYIYIYTHTHTPTFQCHVNNTLLLQTVTASSVWMAFNINSFCAKRNASQCFTVAKF
jgi:hypothetical protein